MLACLTSRAGIFLTVHILNRAIRLRQNMLPVYTELAVDYIPWKHMPPDSLNRRT